MIFYDSVQSAHEKFFTGVLFASYILIFVSFFGLSNSAPEYLATLDGYGQVRWGLDYIGNRYGEPCIALDHWRAKGWH